CRPPARSLARSDPPGVLSRDEIPGYCRSAGDSSGDGEIAAPCGPGEVDRGMGSDDFGEPRRGRNSRPLILARPIMAHDDTIGYALDLLDADERAALEARLAAHPEAAAQVERVRAIAALLELDRDDPEPPADLATRTVSRIEAKLAHPSTLEQARRAFNTDQPEGRSFARRFRGDIVVAAGIGLFVVGLALSFVARARQASEMLACQNNLLTLHQGLSGYADAHEGRFPKVG